MTKARTPTVRESFAVRFECGQTRPIIVTVEPFTIAVRLKGTRRTYRLPIENIYVRAVACEVAFQKREKAKARKARKAGLA